MKTKEEIIKKVKAMTDDELVELYYKAENERWLQEQLDAFKRLRFGTKSEKKIVGQLCLFNEIEETLDHENEQIIEEKEEQEQVITKKRKAKKREANFSALPTNVIHHTLEDTHCEICGTEMKELAPIIMDVLKYQPAHYSVERHIISQYICPNCTDENLEAEIVTAPGAPKKLIKGSVASPSVVAGLAFNKFVSGTPLYRQEQELKRQKVEISRANMSNWLMKCGGMIKPIIQQMKEDIKTLSHVHMDETTVLVLENKPEREKSYMWLAASGKNEAKQMALYYYHKNREHDFVNEIISADYCGCIHSDAYEAYHKLLKALIVGCNAHARRYFVEALQVSEYYSKYQSLDSSSKKTFCEEHPSFGNIVKVIEHFDYCFARERKYIDEGISSTEIKERRQQEQKPVLEELFEMVEGFESAYTHKSKMGKAITYALNQKQYLLNYLNDGEAEISNNRAERLIKPFVMGRKAWLFCNTESGAEMSSMYYSLIESAKLNQLNVYKYLKYILEQIAENGNSLDFSKLTPYSSALPEDLKTK